MNRKIFLLSFLFALVSTLLSAQDELPTGQVEVIKSFEAQLAESEKKSLMPELPPVDTTSKPQTYTVPLKTLPVTYPAPRIRPLAHPRAKMEDPKKAFLKVGAGLPTSFYGKGSFHTAVKDQFDFGIGLEHHSTNQSNETVENRDFNRTAFNARGSYYFPQGFAVGANTAYTQHNYRFYGYNFDDPKPENVDENDVKQHLNTFELGAEIFNGVPTVGDVNYRAGVDIYSRTDNYATSETGLDIHLNGTKWINGVHAFDLGIRADLSTFEDTAKQTLHNFFFTPAFTFHGERFVAKLGGNIANHDDEFFVFPDVEVAVPVTGSELVVFLGANGTLRKNNFRNLTDYNPYVTPRSASIPMRNTEIFHYFGGIRGNLKILEYSGQIGYKSTNDLALFLRDSMPLKPVHRTFRVLYDDVDIINIQGMVKVQPLKGLKIIGTVSQNIYDLKTEEKAWHLPSLELSGHAIYTTLDDQLELKASLFLENGVPYKRPDGTPNNLNTLLDLSLGATYYLTDNFGLWAEVNNLFDNERQRWELYPTYGLNLLFGLSARF